PGSPVEVRPQPVYEGSCDGITRGVLRGWAWAWDPEISVVVEVFVDGCLRGTAPARIDRPDLAIAHIGHGRHGFAWIVPTDLVDGAPHEFACRIAGTKIALRGSPQTAVIMPGDRSLEPAPAHAVRGVATRPQLRVGTGALLRAPQALVDGHLSLAEEALAWERPTALLRLTTVPGIFGRPPAITANGAKRVRLLIPVWGPAYISLFCRTALASLLSPNNLP